MTAHSLEVLMLDGDEHARALSIGRALITPCQAADAELDDLQRLRFWRTLIAYMLGVAEGSVGADGRMAIVQCMRNVPPSTHIAPGALQ